MSSYEYTVIPAPSRGEKARGARSGIERFAATLTDMLNDMARDGWDYVRAETLPAEERTGLTGRTTVYHNLLVFRRALAVAAPQPEPRPAQPAAPAQDLPEPAAEAMAEPAAAQAPQGRGPFSQPMRAARPGARAAEPPLSAPPEPAPAGPRLGPASR